MRRFAVGEVALSKDEPLSVDLTMVPERPTATNTPELDEEVVVVVVEEVLDDVLLFLAHEMIVKLKIKNNIMYIFFIFISFSNLHSQHPLKNSE